MIITENTGHASKLFRVSGKWREFKSNMHIGVEPLVKGIFEDRPLYEIAEDDFLAWPYILVRESSNRSQYDIVNSLNARNVKLPHGILCMAGEGGNFHGFRDRPWISPAGNIYLTAYLAPRRKLNNFGAAFLALAAVSAIDTIDRIPGLDWKAGIKWVNDILIDGAKVCGVLAHTQQEGENVTSAVLGIGLNVLTTPVLEATPFVPAAAALKDFMPGRRGIDVRDVLRKLCISLSENYELLLTSGHKSLLDKYRCRSLVINREVEICLDLQDDGKQLMHKGTVESIGENLELYLAGLDTPVTRGRLILK